MSCTHEMKSGSVVTVVNAGGLAGGCSFCRQAQTERERDALRKALEEALDLAHEGWSYASPYFRDKWQCEKREAELRSVLLPSEERKT